MRLGQVGPNTRSYKCSIVQRLTCPGVTASMGWSHCTLKHSLLWIINSITSRSERLQLLQGAMNIVEAAAIEIAQLFILGDMPYLPPSDTSTEHFSTNRKTVYMLAMSLLVREKNPVHL